MQLRLKLTFFSDKFAGMFNSRKAGVGVSHALLITLIFCEQFLSALAKEYCSFDEFDESCSGPDEVMLMNDARFGRMRVSRCGSGNLTRSCETNVRSIMDRRCSGRRSCRVPVDDSELRQTEPCSKDFTWHLEASFSCIHALNRDFTRCSSSLNPLSLPDHGYLSSHLARTGGYATSDCPWQLRVKPGQTIALKAFVFPPVERPSPSDCYELIKVKDGGDVAVPVTECGHNLVERGRLVYTSQSNEIEVYNSATDNNLIIEYTVNGCATPAVPAGAWGERVGDSFVIHCNNSDEQWSTVCQDGNWLGPPRNCSPRRDNEHDGKNMLFSGDKILPLGVLVAVALGVALGIFIGGILLALCYSRMKRNAAPADAESRRMSTDYQLDLSAGSKYYTDKFYVDRKRTPDVTTGSTTVSSSGYASYHGDLLDSKDISHDPCKHPGVVSEGGHSIRGHGILCGTMARSAHTYDSPNTT